MSINYDTYAALCTLHVSLPEIDVVEYIMRGVHKAMRYYDFEMFEIYKNWMLEAVCSLGFDELIEKSFHSA